ncbi:MAG: type VI secretion system protein TssA [Candidatus Tectomicrobia bacterium]|nr:type VI secretion system protein TssA [Candidatus Tectomicrobia bacterium]
MSEFVASLPQDIEHLFAPVATEQPAGESLRYEGTYDRIQAARRADNPHLPQGVWQKELKKADWVAVRDLCLEALGTRSKDLQLAVWLLEAWLHLEGFAGVNQGLQLLIGLCERFWDELYPSMDGAEVEARIAPLIWMNEKLSLQLKQILLTQPQTAEVLPYNWAQWESAFYAENMAKKAHGAKPEEAEAEGAVTQAKFLESVMLSPTTLYVELADALHDSLEAAVALEYLLDESCGGGAPSLGQFKDTLSAINHLVLDILRDRDTEVSPAMEDSIFAFDQPTEADSVALHDSPDSGYVAGGGPIRNRAEAYQRLSEAADYLIRTEPHSPTPYLIKRAVSWGGMTLTELLQEIVRDDRDLLEIYTLLGVMKHAGEGEDA